MCQKALKTKHQISNVSGYKTDIQNPVVYILATKYQKLMF